MAGNKLSIKLTEEQQNQIQATGKIIRELNIDLQTSGNLSEQDLENIAGGLKLDLSGGI